MSRIQQDTTTFLGGLKFNTIEEYRPYLGKLLPYHPAYDYLMESGMITFQGELLENGTVLKSTLIFQNRELYDMWDKERVFRWRTLGPMLGWEDIEGPTITEID